MTRLQAIRFVVEHCSDLEKHRSLIKEICQCQVDYFSVVKVKDELLQGVTDEITKCRIILG